MDYRERKIFSDSITLEIFLCIVVHITSLYISIHLKYLFAKTEMQVSMFMHAYSHTVICMFVYAHIMKKSDKLGSVENRKRKT